MTAEARPIIEIESLSKTYGLMPALRKLDLNIERGQFVALLGPNGSGKSTLLRLLAGLSRPTAGRIRIGGWELPKEAEAVRAQIGMVSHKSLLYDTLTARENLRFFYRLYHLPAAEMETRINVLLEKVGLLARGDDVLRGFSRGMQQRMSIARALLHDPHVLLLDEPYTGLDQDAAAVLDSLLIQAHQEQHTIVMSTHELDRAARLANRIVILARGRLVHDSAPVDAHTLALTYADVTGMASAR